MTSSSGHKIPRSHGPAVYDITLRVVVPVAETDLDEAIGDAVVALTDHHLEIDGVVSHEVQIIKYLTIAEHHAIQSLLSDKIRPLPEEGI
jgi:hypothetical protein